MAERRCCKQGCSETAAASMSYDYATGTVYVGQLSAEKHPTLYDLCRAHLDRLTPPRGWTIRRERLSAVGSDDHDGWGRGEKAAAARSAI